MIVRIKICCIRGAEQARVAVRAGVRTGGKLDPSKLALFLEEMG